MHCCVAFTIIRGLGNVAKGVGWRSHPACADGRPLKEIV